jgi:hypothetical protein
LRGFLAIKSLVVGLAILGLWGRSYFVGDLVRKGNETQWIELGSAAGSTIVTFGHDGQVTKFEGTWQYVASRDPRQMLGDVWVGEASVWNRLGFGFSHDTYYLPRRGMVFHIVLPHWLVFLLAIPSAVKWAWQRSGGGLFLASYNDSSGETEDEVLECPTCGQLLWKRVPHACPRCGQTLIASNEFA